MWARGSQRRVLVSSFLCLQDLRNGFLVGELLYRHNQLHSYQRLMRADNADAQINNFCLVEPVLRSMGIKFDPPTAYDIMKGRTGAAPTLLYKVKMVLDRLKQFTVRAGGTPVSSYEPEPGGVLPLPNMPMRLSKPEYDRASQSLFEAQVRTLVDNPTEALLAEHLMPFKLAGERFERELVDGKRAAAAAALEADAASRAQRLYEQSQNRAFMAAYEQRGLEVWMVNQEKAAVRKEVRGRVLQKEAAQRYARSDAVRSEAEGAVTGGIADFEARLGLISSQRATLRDDEAPQDAAAVLDSEARAGAMAAQVSAMRAHKFEGERQSLQREKRRRRFITEREEAQVAEYHLRAAEHLQQQLSRTSIAEDSMLTTLGLVQMHRGMMAENRGVRAASYKARAEVDLEDLLKRDNSHLDMARQVYSSELDAQATRCVDALSLLVPTTCPRPQQCHHAIKYYIFAITNNAGLNPPTRRVTWVLLKVRHER